MVKISELVKEFAKKHGSRAAGYGIGGEPAGRCPTGIFPFDLATGGGFVKGRPNIIYGPEASGKSILMYRAIGQHQKLFPKEVCALVDLENTHEEEWATKHGVDCAKLVVIKPSFGEQASDMAKAMLLSEDCGIIAVDSLAAFMTEAETLASASQGFVGEAPRFINRFVNTMNHALNEADVQGGRTPTLLMINQIRMKVGVIKGNPETLPGGMRQLFASSLTVRTYSKAENDPKISKLLPARRHMTAVLRKWKSKVVAQAAEWDMALIDQGPYAAGAIMDWSVLKQYLEKHELLKQEGKQWRLAERLFSTQKAAKEELEVDFKWGQQVRQAIIEEELGSSKFKEAGGEFYNADPADNVEEKDAPDSDAEGDADVV